MNLFFMRSRLPGVIGSIDCVHIPIQSPGGDDAEIYRNRKCYFSINVQLICDTTNYISDVVARWPGSVHDSTIFDHSHIRAVLETSVNDGYLVGDSGYPCRRYLLTPVLNPVSNAEHAYNRVQTAARNCIERTNGMLKRRFPALKYGMRLILDNILPVIVATVVLQNIAVMMGDDDPPDDQQLDTFLADKRRQGMQVDYDHVAVAPPPAVVHTGTTTTSLRRAIIDGHFSPLY